MKSLDNSCRIMATLCNSWEINPRTQMLGHHDIQYDKQDPGNILVSLGYKRNDMSVIDNLVVKYMKADAPTPKVADNVSKPKPGKPPRQHEHGKVFSLHQKIIKNQSLYVVLMA